MPHFQPGSRVAHHQVERALEINSRYETYLASGPGGRCVLKVASVTNPHRAGVRFDLVRQFELLTRGGVPREGWATYRGLISQDGCLVLMMDWIEGERLDSVLESGTVSRQGLLSGLRTLGATVDAFHSAGVIHRDISDKNVLVMPTGAWRLIDFELCAPSPLASDEFVSLRSGNVAFKAPEQWRAQPQDGRADVFAFSVLACTVLLGRRPWADSREIHSDWAVTVETLEVAGATASLMEGLALESSGRPRSCASIACSLTRFSGIG